MLLAAEQGGMYVEGGVCMDVEAGFLQCGTVSPRCLLPWSDPLRELEAFWFVSW